MDLTFFSNPAQLIVCSVIVLASLGVILSRKPVHASLFFLLTLLSLATLYLELSAQFIAAMQILVYAGAILVLFMYVMVLFQQAHEQIAQTPARSFPIFLYLAGGLFVLGLIFFGIQLIGLGLAKNSLPEDYGTVQALGKALYVDYFFPFEAIILVFLVAVIGALYIGKKVK